MTILLLAFSLDRTTPPLLFALATMSLRWWGIINIALLILLYVWARWTYFFYRYELSENGLKIEKGVIWKRYVTIPYDRIQNVDIRRGVWARILGLSDVQVQTAGGGGPYGTYGVFAEGRLPGLAQGEAERLRGELVDRVQRSSVHQGL